MALEAVVPGSHMTAIVPNGSLPKVGTRPEQGEHAPTPHHHGNLHRVVHQIAVLHSAERGRGGGGAGLFSVRMQPSSGYGPAVAGALPRWPDWAAALTIQSQGYLITDHS